MNKRQKEISKRLPTASWCPQILTGLSIQSDGLAPCCEYDDRRIKAQTIEEYKNSVEYKRLLKNMNAGKWSKGCLRCKSREDAGQLSQRLKEVNNQLVSLNYYGQIRPSLIENVANTNQFLWMNLQPTNKCNQACIMCWSGSSSKLQEEQEKYLETHWLKHRVNFFKYNNWQSMAKHLHPSGRIYLSGGEPSVMKDVIQYLDSISNPEEIQIDLNSNFQSFNERFIKILSRFKKIYALASIDAVDSQYEYIRYLGDWKKVEKNLLSTREMLPNANILISPTWTLVNCWEANKLDEWCTKHAFQSKITNVSFTNPFTIMSLEPSFQNELISIFENTNWAKTNTIEVKEIINAIKKSDFKLELFNKFKTYLNTIDDIRKLDYSKTFPMLYRYIYDVNKKYLD